VLVSHLKKFIFVKTIKTAGTSVESYFEQYCMPAGTWTQSHHRDEYIGESGIIGYRGKDKGASTFYNHMPASEIKQLIDTQVWQSYLKFTVVRNPYDKMISAYYFFRKRNDELADREACDIQDFRKWVSQSNGIIDKQIYTIDGKCVMDTYIRYENLHDDMKNICEKLGIAFNKDELPKFKSGYRNQNYSMSDFYDQKTAEKVARLYQFEIDEFGYSLD